MEDSGICFVYSHRDWKTLCSNLERKMLALTWECDEFSSYIIGKTTEADTDHTPLLSLLNSEDLDAILLHIPHLRLCLMRYIRTVQFYDLSCTWKCIYTAYILSMSASLAKSYWLWRWWIIKTHGSESRGQGGSSKQRPDGLETHTREYYTGTRVVKIENAIIKEP